MLMVTPNIVIRQTYTHTCAKYIVGRNVAGCITIHKKCQIFTILTYIKDTSRTEIGLHKIVIKNINKHLSFIYLFL